MSKSPNIVEITREDFKRFLEISKETPILLNLWADWSEPCKSLMPVLAKLADEYQGAFILANLDAEADHEVVQVLGVRSLPTVKLVIDGGIADEFCGALPESEVRTFLNKHVTALPNVEPESADGNETIQDAVVPQASKMTGFDLFLSYSSKDELVVKPIWDTLSQNGLRVFWADEALKSKIGESFFTVIQQSLVSSEHFVLICTENTWKSNWVREEYETFFSNFYIPSDKKRKLIIFETESCSGNDIPAFLKNIQKTNDLKKIIEVVGRK